MSASSENGLVPIFAFTETLVPNTVPTKLAATPGSYFTFPIWQPNGAIVRFMYVEVSTPPAMLATFAVPAAIVVLSDCNVPACNEKHG